MYYGVDAFGAYWVNASGNADHESALKLVASVRLRRSDATHPRQVGYFIPPGTVAAAPAYHHGLVYAAQYSGGIDVLRFRP